MTPMELLRALLCYSGELSEMDLVVLIARHTYMLEAENAALKERVKANENKRPN